MCFSGCGPGQRVEDGWFMEGGDLYGGRCCPADALRLFSKGQSVKQTDWEGGPFYSVQVCDRGKLVNKHILSDFHVSLIYSSVL